MPTQGKGRRATSTEVIHRMNTEKKDYNNCLYHDLTKQLIGFAFDIFKQIGPRYPEKLYQKAYENKLIDNGISFTRENYCRIEVDAKKIGSFRLDFLVASKVVVELKVRNQFLNKDIAQVLTYMRANDIKIGIILLFTNHKVEIKRLIL